MIINTVDNPEGKKYLHKEKQIRVLALRGGTLALLDMMAGDVNTLKTWSENKIFEAISDNDSPFWFLPEYGIWACIIRLRL